MSTIPAPVGELLAAGPLARVVIRVTVEKIDGMGLWRRATED